MSEELATAPPTETSERSSEYVDRITRDIYETLGGSYDSAEKGERPNQKRWSKRRKHQPRAEVKSRSASESPLEHFATPDGKKMKLS
jgi:hypothetical protein